MLLSELLKNLPKSRYMKTKDSGEIRAEINFQGIPIAIENPVGSVREGTKPDGEPWRTTFYYPYGFIKGTKGADDEEIDCFVGDLEDAEMVYVIKQTDRGEFDEHKVMLGFASESAARDAYFAHFDTQGKLQEIIEMPIIEFKKWIEQKTEDAQIDPDFLNLYKNKLEEAIDNDNKEELKRWTNELINHLNSTNDSHQACSKIITRGADNGKET